MSHCGRGIDPVHCQVVIDNSRLTPLAVTVCPLSVIRRGSSHVRNEGAKRPFAVLNRRVALTAQEFSGMAEPREPQIAGKLPAYGNLASTPYAVRLPCFGKKCNKISARDARSAQR